MSPAENEIQADTAVVAGVLEGTDGFWNPDEPANVPVFPNLEAGTIASKLPIGVMIQTIGPAPVGIDNPVHVLQCGDEAEDIVTPTDDAVVDAQSES